MLINLCYPLKYKGEILTVSAFKANNSQDQYKNYHLHLKTYKCIFVLFYMTMRWGCYLS